MPQPTTSPFASLGHYNYTPASQPQSGYSACMPSALNQMPSSLPMIPQAPLQPELRIANGENAISVQWKGVGPLATSYVIEVRESTTSASNLFTQLAPQDASDTLELCIQGLAAGQSYVACVRGVAQHGVESMSSPWSSWLTVPIALQQCELTPSSGHMSSMTLHEIYEMPLQKSDKQTGLVGIQAPPPEITGQEEMILFLD